METKKLRLYVWPDAFCDYTCGIGFAIAEDAEQARDIIEKKLEYRHPDLAARPRVYQLDKPIGFAVYGGG